ncbi:hypothetical protein AGMMS50293_08840 [Spirochaetia bacterium]|nr:hypothetical protein AGMMS50293_08840 [Spirochaetia bacterium]
MSAEHLGDAVQNLNLRVVFVQGAFTAMQCASTVYFVQAFQRFGYDNLLIGTIMMFTSLLAIFVQPLWGYIVDKIVMDRQIIAGSCLLGAVIYFIFIFSGGRKAVAIPSAIAMYGVFIPMMTLIDAFVSKLIVDGYHINYSATRSGGSIAYAFTAVIFGFSVSRFGMHLAPFIYLVPCAVMMWALWGLPNPRGHIKNAISLRSGFQYLRHYKLFLLFIGAYFLMSLTSVPASTYYSVVLYKLGGDERHVGLGLFFQAICEVPVMLLFSRIKKKTGIKSVYLLMIGMIFFALKTACIAFAPTITVVLLGSMLQGFSFAIFHPAVVEFLMEIIRREYLATAQMITVAIGSSLAAIVINPLGGAASDSFGPQNMLKCVIAFAPLGAVLLFTAWKLAGKKEGHYAENPA